MLKRSGELMKLLKNRIKSFNRFCILLDLFIHIWKHGKHERIIQYLGNRLPKDQDFYYMTDEWLFNHLRQKDQEFKYDQNKMSQQDEMLPPLPKKGRFRRRKIKKGRMAGTG